MRFSILTLVGALIGGAAWANDESPCHVAEPFVHADFALPHVAAAVAEKSLEAVVIGTASSAIAGPAGAGKAYPVRFEAALKPLLPGVAVRIITYSKPRQSAAEMQQELERVLATDKPALVVWQTGTADAIRGIDPDDFRGALEDGLDTVRDGGADAVLMNMQYSPRTESMIALGAYADAMRFVALQREVNLFDRFAVMKHWNEVGTFDLYAATKKTDMAERVHDCIGRLLAGLVIEGTKLTGASANENK